MRCGSRRLVCRLARGVCYFCADCGELIEGVAQSGALLLDVGAEGGNVVDQCPHVVGRVHHGAFVPANWVVMYPARAAIAADPQIRVQPAA